MRLVFSKLTAASHVFFTMTTQRRYEFNVALNAEVSSAQIRIISFLPSPLIEIFDLDVVDFFASGSRAFNEIFNILSEGSSM